MGEARAEIAQVAASLRTFTVNGIDVTEPYPEFASPPYGDGIVLVPWPNRIEDGLWTLDGVPMQLDITEPARNTALHGLLVHTAYDVVEQTDSAVTLSATVYPQNGYPFLLDTTVRYEITDDGLVVTHEVHNVSAVKAPVAIGTHPFLTIGDVPSEELVLTINAATRFEVDERLIPTGEKPVDGTRYDLRGGRTLADVYLDDAFGQVEMIDDVSRHWIEAPDGRRVELWQDKSCEFVQVFVTREFPKNGGVGLAVAVEPMTAPPNAFNTGQGLRWLAPDERWSVQWGVRYLPGNA